MQVFKKFSLGLWLLSAIAGITIFVNFFHYASPVASVDIVLGKSQILKKAKDFIKDHDFDLEGFDQAIRFASDQSASAYLQKTQGIEKSNEFIRKGIPIWFWRVRFFKELQKEGFNVGIDPSNGKIVNFFYSVLDDAKGADLSREEAKIKAEAEIIKAGINLDDYEIKDIATKKQKHRTDHYFVWEKKGYKIEEATLRINIDIYGDKLGAFRRYLKLPEGFFRELQREMSLGKVLSMISNILKFFMILAAVFILIIKHQYDHSRMVVSWKFGAAFGGSIICLTLFSFLNGLPLMWNFYSDTISKAMFVMISVQNALISAIAAGFMVFALGTFGEFLSRNFGETKLPLVDSIRKKEYSSSKSLPIFVVGYSLAFIFLGYVTLFYMIGSNFFNIWMPPKTVYSNILGTFFPFIVPLSSAASASINEEFVFRLFAISFFSKYMRSKWLLVFVPAFIWGFAHSGYAIYPVYVRGIELTIFGMLLGMVFLKYEKLISSRHSRQGHGSAFSFL